MFECAKSRGKIHPHLFSICADKQPYSLLQEMEGGESQEVADELAKWARGALSLTEMRPADTPEGGLEMHNVRAPDGEWDPRKDRNADAPLFREAESFRPHHIACANSYFFPRIHRILHSGPQERRVAGPVARRHPQEMPNGAGRGSAPRQAGAPGRETLQPQESPPARAGARS